MYGSQKTDASVALDARERAREALQVAYGDRRGAKQLLDPSDTKARYWVKVMAY